jgi:uncharacterized protein (DUF488 family)
MAEEARAGVLTIGHSAHPYETFLDLLRRAEATAVADVRTSPYSRHFPQFTAEALKAALARDGIAYSYLGKELGGRPGDSRYYRDGVADYERMATAPEFASGLARVLDGARKYRLVLMCSEQEPLECHRCLLVGRALAARGAAVGHILPDGRVEPHDETEERLLRLTGRAEEDLFASREERLRHAYREQGRRAAFEVPDPDAVAAE